MKTKKERVLEVNWVNGGMTSFPKLKAKSMILDEERNMLTFAYGGDVGKRLIASINLNNVKWFEIITTTVLVSD